MKLFNRRKVKRNPKIEIIPMVDVMFLLLVFYILSSLALHSQKGVPVSLPRADTSQAGDSNQELVLTISESGEYFLGAEKVDQQNIGEAITTFAASRGGLEVYAKGSVTLNADLHTQHKHVVYAMDQLRQLGLDNFVIATGSPAGSTSPKP